MKESNCIPSFLKVISISYFFVQHQNEYSSFDNAARKTILFRNVIIDIYYNAF